MVLKYNVYMNLNKAVAGKDCLIIIYEYRNALLDKITTEMTLNFNARTRSICKLIFTFHNYQDVWPTPTKIVLGHHSKSTTIDNCM